MLRNEEVRGAYDLVRIDDRPDHLIPPGVMGSCLCRCAVISASMSGAVSVSSSRRLAPLHAFCSQSGGVAAIRKFLHAHDDNGGFAATVDNKPFIVFGGEIHDLPNCVPAI